MKLLVRSLTISVWIAAVILLTGGQIVQSVDPDECGYDPQTPTIENARSNFDMFMLECAVIELEDLLRLDNLSAQQRAEAGFLLAAAHFYRTEDSPDVIREKVIGAAKDAFKADPEWSGTYDVDDPDFLNLIDRARQQADEELAEEARQREMADQARRDSLAGVQQARLDSLEYRRIADSIAFQTVIQDASGKESKRWYQKRWVQIVGVGIVAGTAAALLGGGGGGGGDEPIDNTLPGFPDPPEGQ